MNFAGEARRWLRFTYYKCFREVGYPQHILVILEDGVVIFLHVMEDHQLNDLLHRTQCVSKWQLAPFYKTGTILNTLQSVSNNSTHTTLLAVTLILFLCVIQLFSTMSRVVS
jgi:hypothetical protein